jgi:hypothetical protein
MVGVVLSQPAGATVGVVEHVGAPTSLCQVVAGAVEHAPRERTLPRRRGTATSARERAL